MATATDLQAYVKASPADAAFLDDCLKEATALVAGYIGTDTVPPDVRSRAVLEVGSELYHRRQAPQGVAQFATPDGMPVRVGRDPMAPARPLLDPFLPGGFA